MALPNVMQFSQIPGGGINAVMNSNTQNAISNLKGQLENQYYVPNIESQMGYRNALTQGQNISNQYMPQKMQLANELQQLKNKYYSPNILSEISQRNALTNKYNTMTPLEAEQMRLSNQWAPQLNQSTVDTNRALSQYRLMGGGRMGVDQQAIQGLKGQIQLDNPSLSPEEVNEIAGVALEGGDRLSNGNPIPKLSGSSRSMITDINKKHSTAAIQNQASNMDVLASDINDIDISPVAKFAGLPGKLNAASYQANMALGKPVPEEYRDYLAFKRISSNFAMDAIRKGFGTSVVPGYVYATLGKAANPASSFWNDPEQVVKEWNTTKKWVNENAKKYKTKANKGATASLGENNKNIGKATHRYNPQSGEIEEIK